MATGQYAGNFTVISATICMLVYGYVPIAYSTVINILTVIGIVIGIQTSKLIIMKTGRHSYVILLMVLSVLLIMLSTLAITVDQIIMKKDLGLPLFESLGYCN